MTSRFAITVNAPWSMGSHSKCWLSRLCVQGWLRCLMMQVRGSMVYLICSPRTQVYLRFWAPTAGQAKWKLFHKKKNKKTLSHCCALLRALIIYIFPLSRSSQPTEDSKEWRSVSTWRNLFLRNTETAVGLIVKKQLSFLTACVSWASAGRRYVILKI